MISILDLGTSKINAALASNENNKLKILEFCTVKSEGFQSGTIVDLNLASKSIRKCIFSTKLRYGYQNQLEG